MTALGCSKRQAPWFARAVWLLQAVAATVTASTPFCEHYPHQVRPAVTSRDRETARVCFAGSLCRSRPLHERNGYSQVLG